MSSGLWLALGVWGAACGSDDSKGPDPVIPGAVPVRDVGFLVPDESGTGNVSAPSFAACAETVAQAEARAADLFIMLDHTGSMGSDCPLSLDGEPSGNSKWCYATHALAQYFTSVAAAGNRAALQFMSGPDFVCDGGPDNGAARAAIDLTDLPVSRDHALITALDASGPTGGMGTQIEAALRGIADYTRNNQVEGRTMVGVLATDGDPNGCEQNVGRLANIIETHLRETGIRTFLIGMTGASLNNLERMAAAGGAPEHADHCGNQRDCHFWSVGDGDPVAFVDALSQIEAAAVVPCSYSIPDAPAGSALDNDLVNVLFRAKNGTEFVVSRVADCAGTGGWTYDDPTDPSILRLCGSTCDAVTAEGIGASVSIAYGCSSVIQ
ncbi:MAG TPA: vWA domain-containing protein [Polyangiaceae bacterium]|nr:vWA domain-containing protein [Polyangiaceae bacterium]